MPQTIARLYGSQESATAAVNELRARGIKAEAIQAGARPETPEAAGSPGEPALEPIMKAGVDPKHAEIYAERVERGEVLVVVVDPPFGFALTAISILERHHPIAVDLPAAQPPPASAGTKSANWKSAAPLSEWFGWRLLSNDPTPLSNFLNRPVLQSEPKSSPTLERIRQSSRDAAPLSSRIGMAVLSDNPAPLSERFGWRLLSDKAAPLSERFGWRLLSDDPAPFSNRFGWSLLSDNPTPLSSRLGWKVLSKE